MPSSVPAPHRRFLHRSVELLRDDPRIAGLAVGGSFVTDAMDEFSDLDLIIAVEPDAYGRVMVERRQIAASLGQLLAAFTGDHVGEPRLIICLYGVPLLHVELKFVALTEVAKRVEDPAVLWERDGRFTRALEQGKPEYPLPNLQWIEDRFWIWVHYGAGKIGRGELFEAIEFLSFLRVSVLGPLGLRRSGGRPAGVRKIEMIAPEFARELRRTVADYEAVDCIRALRACVDLYRSLRMDADLTECRGEAERAAMEYLSEVAQRCGLTERIKQRL